MKILIVDDNKDLASILQMMLENEGYEVKMAADGIHGYSTYLVFNPDLIITDIQMPGENGLELMEHIRRHNPCIRTIYMSGDLGSYWLSIEEERKKYPVNALAKPFSRGELMKLVSEQTL